MTLDLAAILCAAVHAGRVNDIEIVADSEQDARERLDQLRAVGASGTSDPKWRDHVEPGVGHLRWFRGTVYVGSVTIGVSTRTEVTPIATTAEVAA